MGDLLDGVYGTAEEVAEEFLETSTGNRCVEVNALEQGVDLDGRLVNRKQGVFNTLASSAQPIDGTRVGGDV